MRYNKDVEGSRGAFYLPTTSRYSVAPLPSTRTGKAGWRLVVGEGQVGRGRKFSKDTRDISLDLRLRIFEKGYGLCVYCGGFADEVDHVIPWHFSHNSEERNLVASCQLCNNLAQGKIFSSFHAKKSYILMQRAKRGDIPLCLWMSCCTWCHALFSPGVNCATNLICPKCADDNGQPTERPLSE